jgi:hypothetical protein
MVLKVPKDDKEQGVVKHKTYPALRQGKRKAPKKPERVHKPKEIEKSQPPGRNQFSGG